MTEPSTRMGLALPTQADRFSTADIRANWEKLDAAPGTHICLSTTRPNWTAAQAGRKILETNTGLEWVWSGSSWLRLTGGQGMLRKTNGTMAISERSSDFSTSSKDYVKVVAVQSVSIPAGKRPLMVVGLWYQADNNAGPYAASIYRSSTSNSGPRIANQIIGAFGSERGAGGQIIAFERDGLTAGTYDFSLQIKSLDPVGGTSWMYGSGATPITITVIEL